MGIFDDAAKNYERRKQIAEYNYQARECISQGQKIYEDAYYSLKEACWKVANKVDEYQRYKMDVLGEINRTMRNIDSNHKQYNLSTFVNFDELDSCAVHQEEKLDVIDKVLATWVQPSITDFFHDNTMDYYEARANRNRARRYKEEMKMHRERLRNAKYAVQKIPDFISDEKRQIEELMRKFRKTAEMIDGEYSSEKVSALSQIAKMIAESMTTQFIDNNYQITEQYKGVSNQLTLTNNMLSGVAWLIGG